MVEESPRLAVWADGTLGDKWERVGRLCGWREGNREGVGGGGVGERVEQGGQNRENGSDAFQIRHSTI